MEKDKEQAHELIERMLYIRAAKVDSDKERYRLYEQALAADDPEGWIMVAKSCYLRNREMLKKDRVLPAEDSAYRTAANDKINGRLAALLEIKKEEVDDYVAHYLAETL